MHFFILLRNLTLLAAAIGVMNGIAHGATIQTNHLASSSIKESKESDPSSEKPFSTDRIVSHLDLTASTASWYGPGFYGNRTANGEVFRPGTLTAAHKSLRFGTRVKVTNLNNNRSVVVRINDDGPHVPGRVIDLSEAAAARIGMLSSGVAPVRLEVLN